MHSYHPAPNTLQDLIDFQAALVQGAAYDHDVYRALLCGAGYTGGGITAAAPQFCCCCDAQTGRLVLPGYVDASTPQRLCSVLLSCSATAVVQEICAACARGGTAQR